MSIAETLGLTPGKKVRYAFVALGDIAQEAVLPGVDHSGNSEVVALVSGDPGKARAVAERYGVADVRGYDDLLRSGGIDATTFRRPTSGTPNSPSRPGRGGARAFGEAAGGDACQ